MSWGHPNKARPLGLAWGKAIDDRQGHFAASMPHLKDPIFIISFNLLAKNMSGIAPPHSGNLGLLIGKTNANYGQSGSWHPSVTFHTIGSFPNDFGRDSFYWILKLLAFLGHLYYTKRSPCRRWRHHGTRKPVMRPYDTRRGLDTDLVCPGLCRLFDLLAFSR